MKCIFGCRNAVGVYILPKGCVCKREIVQPLCAQHEHKCMPLGKMILVTRWEWDAQRYWKFSELEQLIDGRP